MALKLGSLFFDFSANTSKLDRAQNDIVEKNKKVTSSFKTVGTIISAAFGLESIRRAALLADQMQLLDVRIKNSTKSQKAFNLAQQELLRITSETGTTLENNVRLFEAFTIAGRELNSTNEQILAFTEAINKLGVVGGTSQERLSNATLQLSQALTGGTVRAEEFNSIVENTPLIAEAIAKGLGVSVGELRKMVLEGKLLSKDVFNSILGQTGDIEKRFKTFPITIERAGNSISTAFAQVIKDGDEIIGITDLIAGSMEGLAKILRKDVKPVIFDIKALAFSIVSGLDKLFINVSAGISLAKAAVSDFLGLNERATSEIIEQIEREKEFRLKNNKEFTDDFINNLIKQRLAEEENTRKRSKLSLSTDPGQVGEGDSTVQGTSALDKIEADLGNETQVIINALLERNKKILEITGIGEEERRNLLLRSSELTTRQLSELEQSRQQTALASLSEFNNNFLQVLQSGGKEQTAVAKAIFLANKAIQVAQILAATKVAAAQAAAVAALGGPQAFFATESFITATGFANAGFVAGLGVSEAFKGGGRQFGGIAPSGILTPVTEDGDPEIFRQGARQFLLPGRGGGMVEPLGEMSGGGMPKIVINNNAAGVDVSVGSVSRDQVEIIAQKAEDRAVQRVNSSLSQGRGSTSNALTSRFKVERNVR